MHRLDLPQLRYYRLLEDLTIDGEVIFPVGTCMPETWVRAMRCPPDTMVEIPRVEAKAWFAADLDRAERAKANAFAITRLIVQVDLALGPPPESSGRGVEVASIAECPRLC
jgi:hypothetical protein